MIYKIIIISIDSSDLCDDDDDDDSENDDLYDDEAAATAFKATSAKLVPWLS